MAEDRKKAILPFERPVAELEEKLEELQKLAKSKKELDDGIIINTIRKDIEKFDKKIKVIRKSIYKKLSRWQKVQLSRHPNRPLTLDYVSSIMESFTELSGDRCFGDDKALIGGFATLTDHQSFSQTVMVVGHQKGKDTKENLYRNFGMPEPEGYRKAVRLMKLAEKFNKPIITFIDTPGAAPGIGAEERGQAEAIAKSMYEMSKLSVPIICTIIGDGASGGAIGIGIGDRILMLQNAWYSVISPESCSSILWRNWDHKEEAAEALKLTAEDLLKQSVIDEIIPESLGGAHVDPKTTMGTLKAAFIKNLKSLLHMDPKRLVKKRIDRLSNLGKHKEL